MLKIVSKFAMDIFPSVIATILGAYIVQHYINNKQPAAGATAAAIHTSEPKKAAKADWKSSKPAEKSADLGNNLEPGVRAKGVSEKSIMDKSASEKAAVEKAAEKADRPSETASIPPVAPTDTRHRQSAPREKAASKTTPATAPAAEPVVAAPATASPAEAQPDANDLARAAIERLRGTDPAPRVQESARSPEPPKAAESPRVAATPPAPAPVPVVAAPALQPLPPPILVSTPPTADAKPPAAGNDDPNRPTPPADIPDPHPPLDLRADAATDQPAKRPFADVLSAAKSMFNSVLPKQQQQQ